MSIKNSCVFVLGFAAFGCVLDVAESTREGADAESSLRSSKIRYEQIDMSLPPSEYDFWGATGLSDDADVFGVGFDCTDDFSFCSIDLLKVDRNADFSVVLEDFAVNEVNGPGDAGGCVLDDAAGTSQAAVLSSNGRLELIPRLPGEISSCIVQLSDHGTALVFSQDESSALTTYVVRGRRTYAFPLEGAEIWDMNDDGTIAGVLQTDAGERAFRFDSRTQTNTILEPISPDPHSWGLGINRRGEVLGYSFEFGATERIGKWNKQNEFEVSFVEGTPEFPTVSNQLNWNENGFIVVSYAPTDEKTYLIPKPGVRLDLADLVGGAVVPSTLVALDVNDRADFVATSLVDGTTQLYRRIKH
jgi:hypothetical protein